MEKPKIVLLRISPDCHKRVKVLASQNLKPMNHFVIDLVDFWEAGHHAN